MLVKYEHSGINSEKKSLPVTPSKNGGFPVVVFSLLLVFSFTGGMPVSCVTKCLRVIEGNCFVTVCKHCFFSLRSARGGISLDADQSRGDPLRG